MKKNHPNPNKKNRKFFVVIAILSVFLFISPPSKAQDNSSKGGQIEQAIPLVLIKGQIKDDQNSPLPGANISVKGTEIGTVADSNGFFELKAPAKPAPLLLISFLGRESKELSFKGSDLNVVLYPSIAELKQVIVTGIFDRNAGSYTGAVTTIRKENIEKVGNQNILQSLKNLAPSFQIIEDVNFGSDPNRLPDIQMRGASNFSDMKDRYQTNPNQPLFVVDGFEVSIQKVLDMDINRVASITLLKDATAKALYGSKGANGVVVIETVVPTRGLMKVTYNGDYTISAPDLTSYNLTNAAEKLETERLAGVYTANDPLSQQNLNELYNTYYNDVLRGVDTYWLSTPLHVGIGQKHALYLEGGDDITYYGINFSYNKTTGVMKGSDRKNIAGDITFRYRYRNFIFRNLLSVNFNKADNSPYGNYSEYSRLNPYWRMYDDDGSVREILGRYSRTNSQGSYPIYNPLINATLNTKNASSYQEFTNNFYAEWNAFEGMRITGRFGVIAQRNDSEVFLPRDHTTFREITIDSEEYFNRGRYTQGNGKSFSYDADLSANYSKLFGKHLIFANAQFSTSERSSEVVYFQAEGFANNKMDYITHAKQYLSGGSPYGNESLSREVSYLVSTNYSYADRYLLDATFRMNGSSLFGKNNRWSSYWSVGAGWNLHKEDFLQDSKVIERLRLRASTGYSGYQNFLTYQALASYKYYQEGYDNIVGAYQLSLSNNDLRAQKTQDTNFGLDASLFNRFDLILDYYVKNTDDLLTPVNMPPSTGFASYVENLGQTKNVGFETSLNYRIIRDSRKQLFLSVFASGVHNKNKLVKISDALVSFNDTRDESKATQVPNLETDHVNNKHVTQPSVRYIEGQSMSSIWAVRSYGIDPLSGKEVFVKADGSLTNTWDPNDQVVCGDAMPKFSGNFGFNIEYKGFSVNTVFSYRAGGQYYNQTLVNEVENADIQYNVDRRLFTDRWNPETPGVATKYKTFSRSAAFTRPTSRFVQDLNELQFASLNVGYDFRNLDFVKNGLIERLKVSFYANDLFRISTVKTERGIEYPFARLFSFKIQATF